jgi:hypothetical protein
MGYMKEEVKRINISAVPESGARLADVKIDDLPQQEVSGKLHNGRSLPPVQTVKAALEDRGAAKRAREKQIGGTRVPVFKRGNFEEVL